MSRGKTMARRIGALHSSKYVRYAEKLLRPIDETLVLVDSRHGTAFEGNMYYIAREIATNPAFSHLRLVVPVDSRSSTNVRRQIASIPAPIETVEYMGDDYLEALARAKFLFCDTSLPFSFYKRPEQVYVNTWHGTPLKHLGRSATSERSQLGNVQRNFLCADILLLPNAHTRDTIMEEYMVGELYRGRVLMSGYPCNGALLDEGLRAKTRARLGIEDMRAYAFMPTYREASDDGEGQFATLTRQHLERFSELLDDDEVLFYKAHPFMAGHVSCEGLSHVRALPEDVPAYDFLAATDGLVTDYSSIMFDYCCTARPVALLAHDADEYAKSRGMYFDLDELGFPCARTPEGVMKLLRSPAPQTLSSLRQTFCAHDSVDAASKAVNAALECAKEKKAGQTREEAPVKRERVLVRVDGIDAESLTGALERYFDDPGLAKRSYYVTFDRRNPNADDVIAHLPRHVGYFATALVSQAPTIRERQAAKRFAKGLLSPGDFDSTSAPYCMREWQRRFGDVAFTSVVDIGTYRWTDAEVLSFHPNYRIDLPNEACSTAPLLLPKKREREFLELRGASANLAPAWLEKLRGAPNPERDFKFALTAPRFFANDRLGLGFQSLVVIKANYPQLADELHLRIGDTLYKARLRPVAGRGNVVSGMRAYRIKFALAASDLAKLQGLYPIHACFVHDGHINSMRELAVYRSVTGRKPADVALPLAAGTARFTRSARGTLALEVSSN